MHSVKGVDKRSVNFKMSFWCLQIFQKKKNSRVSALASKKRSNQKSSVSKRVKIKSSNLWYKVPLFV